MKKIIMILLAGLLLSTALYGCGSKTNTAAPTPEPKATETASTVYGEYLSVADVEEVTGITGLKASEEPLTLKFSSDVGTVVYEVKFYDSSYYKEEVDGNRDYYTDVPGIGDKAAICLPDSPYRLTFIKGDRCIMTQTLSRNSEGKWLLSEEQLVSIAKIIASKL